MPKLQHIALSLTIFVTALSCWANAVESSRSSRTRETCQVYLGVDWSTSTLAEGKRIRDNVFRVYEADMKQVDAFLRDPAFDGSVVVPPNHGYQFNVGDKIVKVLSLVIDRQSTDTQRLFKDIKARSLSNIPAKEREFGAIVIILNDGRSIVAKFTSNEFQSISEHSHWEAINGALKSNGATVSQVNELIHIHTHPAARGSSDKMQNFVAPNPDDVESLRFMQRFLRGTNPSARVRGIVLPTTPTFANIFFYYDPDM